MLQMDSQSHSAGGQQSAAQPGQFPPFWKFPREGSASWGGGGRTGSRMKGTERVQGHAKPSGGRALPQNIIKRPDESGEETGPSVSWRHGPCGPSASLAHVRVSCSRPVSPPPDLHAWSNLAPGPYVRGEGGTQRREQTKAKGIGLVFGYKGLQD